MRVTILVVIGLIASSSLTVTSQEEKDVNAIQSLSLSFGELSILEEGPHLSIQMQGAPACVYDAKKPILPSYTTTIELPFGSSIEDLKITFDDIHTKVLPKKIVPAPDPIPCQSKQGFSEKILDNNIYTSEKFFPEHWIAYTTGGGLNKKNIHVTFLTIQVFPVRYSPATNTILYIDECRITITYTPPRDDPFPTDSLFDLVIITPKQFLAPVQRLADHKNAYGVSTQIKILEDIYQQYPGIDCPEQIKYFIKNAVETWGAHYILLVGGLKSHFFGKARDDINEGTRDWHLPVRYSNLQEIGICYDPGFISDLYYADIYNGEGSFCSWDSNGDGIFGDWSTENPLSSRGGDPDEVDFYPDIYLGRFPCRNTFEVHNIVNKIIAYESEKADDSWFKRILVVAGDPHDDQATSYAEGELIGNKALTFMLGFQHQRLYASYREGKPEFTPTTKNIVREFSSGCGFLLLDGHGSPAWWNTFWPGEFDSMIKNGGLSLSKIYRLQNKDRLPVCIIGGCHCSLFNVTLWNTISDPRNRHSMWSFGQPIPECFSWSLTVKPQGGSIASIGSTGLGYEAGGEVGDLNGDYINEPDCVEALGGFLEVQFFKAYAVNHHSVLGDAWGAAITEYLHIYPGMNNQIDAKTIEQWVLLGDPSLMIGGY